MAQQVWKANARPQRAARVSALAKPVLFMVAPAAALLTYDPVLAQVPSPLTHWQHTSWSVPQALPVPGGHGIAQSEDGYIWFGAVGGLLRFDGLRFTFVDSHTSAALRSTVPGEFRPQMPGANGEMWVLRPDGALLRYSNGRFHAASPADSSSQVVEDRSGRLWIAGSRTGAVHVLDDAGLRPAPLPPLIPDTGVIALVRDTADGLWIGTRSRGLWHVRGALATHIPSPVERLPDEVRPLFQSRDGTLWAIGIGLGTGLHRYSGGRWSRVVPPGVGEGVRGRAVIDGPDGAVWIATHGNGVLRWYDGELEQFTEADGLSDANTRDILVDRAGAIWIVTDAAIDRLRPVPFSTLRRQHGLPFDSPYRVAEDRHGTLWAQGGPDRAIYRLSGGAVAGQSGGVSASRVELPPGESYELLGAAHDGGIWIGPHRGGLLRHRDGVLSRIQDESAFSPHFVSRLLEAADGTLWLALARVGFGRMSNGQFEPVNLPGANPLSPVLAFARDSTDRVWVSTAEPDLLFRIDSDGVATRIELDPAISGAVLSLAAAGSDTLWGVTNTSVFRMAAERATRVEVPALERLLAAGPHVTVHAGYLWIASESGIARTPLAALDAAADGRAGPIDVKVFDALDGLATPRITSWNLSPIGRTTDGRLWFSTPAGFAVVRTPVATVRRLPPRMQIEHITVDGRPFAVDTPLAIQPHPDRLSIRVTATDVLMPERVRIEYMLEGVDGAWQSAGADRTAEYTQLRPGHYRFRSRAWNEVGMPSLAEASVAIRVLPAWYQTNWFLAFVLLLTASVGFTAAVQVQKFRLRRALAEAGARFDATIAERTRIARELHDSLIQGFTGIALQLEAVRSSLGARNPATQRMTDILAMADATLREARDVVWDMRSIDAPGTDIPLQLEQVVRRVARGRSIDVHSSVDGTSRQMSRAIRDTLYRTGREAVVNAVRHASPRTIRIRLTFVGSSVVLEVCDDGRGAPMASFHKAVEEGHWGVAGMRERVRLMGGSLDITSTPERGTAVVVSIPVEEE